MPLSRRSVENSAEISHICHLQDTAAALLQKIAAEASRKIKERGGGRTNGQADGRHRETLATTTDAQKESERAAWDESKTAVARQRLAIAGSCYYVV